MATDPDYSRRVMIQTLKTLKQNDFVLPEVLKELENFVLQVRLISLTLLAEIPFRLSCSLYCFRILLLFSVVTKGTSSWIWQFSV